MVHYGVGREHAKPGEAIQDTMGKANGGEAVEYTHEVTTGCGFPHFFVIDKC
jgi:hypothetical protein